MLTIAHRLDTIRNVRMLTILSLQPHTHDRVIAYYALPTAPWWNSTLRRSSFVRPRPVFARSFDWREHGQANRAISLSCSRPPARAKQESTRTFCPLNNTSKSRCDKVQCTLLNCCLRFHRGNEMAWPRMAAARSLLALHVSQNSGTTRGQDTHDSEALPPLLACKRPQAASRNPC